MNERIVCLDVGDVRIGVAVSDALRMIATPVEVITRVGWGPDTRKIAAVCERYDTRLVLSGLPLNMDGTEGLQAEKVRGLCAQLEKAGLTVRFSVLGGELTVSEIEVQGGKANDQNEKK